MEFNAGDITPLSEANVEDFEVIPDGSGAGRGESVPSSDLGLLDGAGGSRHDSAAGLSVKALKDHKDALAGAAGSSNERKKSVASDLQAVVATQLVQSSPAYMQAYENRLSIRGSDGQQITLKQGNIHRQAQERAAKAKTSGDLRAAAAWAAFALLVDPANGAVTQEQIDQYLKDLNLDQEEFENADPETEIEAQSEDLVAAATFDEISLDDQQAVASYGDGTEIAFYESFFDQLETTPTKADVEAVVPTGEIQVSSDFASANAPENTRSQDVSLAEVEDPASTVRHTADLQFT